MIRRANYYQSAAKSSARTVVIRSSRHVFLCRNARLPVVIYALNNLFVAILQKLFSHGRGSHDYCLVICALGDVKVSAKKNSTLLYINSILPRVDTGITALWIVREFVVILVHC